MKIVVYEEATTQEDGSVVREWVAALEHKEVTARGATATLALQRLAGWLRASTDTKDARAADVDAVRYDPPHLAGAPDESLLGANANPLQPVVGPPDAVPSWEVTGYGTVRRGDARFTFAAPRPLYHDASAEWRARFAAAHPAPASLIAAAGVLAGWEVRAVMG